MPAVGELVRCTNGGWMVRPPQRCPRGHRLALARRSGWVYLDVDIYRRIGPDDNMLPKCGSTG